MKSFYFCTGAHCQNRTSLLSLPWIRSTDELSKQKMAAVIGIEPMNDGVRVRCLTAWLNCYFYDNMNFITNSYSCKEKILKF